MPKPTLKQLKEALPEMEVINKCFVTTGLKIGYCASIEDIKHYLATGHKPEWWGK